MQSLIAEWRPVVGWEGFCEVSSGGDVKSLSRIVSPGDGRRPYVKRETILRPALNKNGYLHVGLRANGQSTSEYVHRIVANAFASNPNGYSTVNHKNGIKTDNRAENLEWASPSENSKHASASGLMRTGSRHCNAKLTEDDVKCIFFLLAKGELTCKEIASLYGVYFTLIQGISSGRYWRHVKRPDGSGLRPAARDPYRSPRRKPLIK